MINDSKYYLGSICKYGHEYQNSGQSLRRKHGDCIECCKKACRRSYHRNKHKYKHRSYYKITTNKINCTNCTKEFDLRPDKIKLRKNHFCSKSCNATYNNKNKTYGIRRSKLEKWIEDELLKIFIDLDIHFNRKDAIMSELDIYIPKLRLAFELNGILHYKPIYGIEKLELIQDNDKRKIQSCITNEIELHILDTSFIKSFKEEDYKYILDKITDTINKILRI